MTTSLEPESARQAHSPDSDAAAEEASSSDPVASVPPRSLVRSFWAVHRSIYRLSAGRLGLRRPKAGKRFGFMRLETVGRRSGEPRMTIIGYFEDGPNLVTLAMNGWAEADPAWWLNLQANPKTTVTLPGERRAVRARPAKGIERERLWAKVGDYPGWGTDIDALAALRSRPTTVVVFEPLLADEGSEARSESGDASVEGGVPEAPGQ